MKQQRIPLHSATVHPGDCRETMRRMADSGERFDAIVTDPPYHLTTGKKGNTGPASLNPNSPAGRSRIGTGFMGKAWDGGDIAFDVETWRAALSVLKPGGHLAAFGGTRTFHRMAVAIEDAGFELRDTLMWMYGTGFPKSHDVSKGIDKRVGVKFEKHPAFGVGFMGPNGPGGYNPTINRLKRIGDISPEAAAWTGWGTALKPAWEPIILARRPLDGTVANNVLTHGCGGLNVDACRVEALDGVRSAGGTKRSGGIMGVSTPLGGWQSSSGQGRWPANVILSSPEDEYVLKSNVTAEQRKELFGWLHANA